MKHALVFLFTLAYFTSLSQNQGNIWYFGDSAGLDFNTSPPTPLTDGQTHFHPPLGWNEGSTSISDSSGNLLCYSNGETVWTRNHTVMANGTDLMGHSSATSSSLIVPLPGSDQLYYLFTVDAYENDYQNGLRYSVIDMCANDSLGEVIEDHKNILLHDTVSEKLCVIRHANGQDYWVVTRELDSDAFVAIRLTANGLMDTIISNTGTVELQGWGGQLVASPDGMMMAFAIPNAQSFGKSVLLDFDPSTGVASNERVLSTGGREGGVSFSPDGTKLYFSTMGFGQLFQYDLTAGNLSAIIASKTYLVQNGPDGWRYHRLGPDGKIYVSRTGRNYLSIIEFPNVAGTNCNYVDSALYLGGRNTSFGLPDFVTAYDYSNTTIRCDSNPTDTNVNDPSHVQVLSEQHLEVNLYPNPSSGHLHITTSSATQLPLHITASSLQGETVWNGQVRQQEADLDVSVLPSGMFIVRIFSETGRSMHTRILIE